MVRLLDRTYMKPVLASVKWSTDIWISKSSTSCVKGFRNQRMSASYITIQDTSSVVRPHGYIVQAPIHNMHKANGFVLHLVTRIPNYSHHIKETKLHPHTLHRATKSIVSFHTFFPNLVVPTIWILLKWHQHKFVLNGHFHTVWWELGNFRRTSIVEKR
jgi:hypothetical protein